MRGRWPGPLAITFAIEDANAPLPLPEWRAGIADALRAWAATGVVRFVPAAAEAAPDLTFVFRRGHHGACEPFGTSTSVAHSGPVRPGTFVHFDQDRAWSERGGESANSVFHVAVHELGHVLGLGHSAAEDVLMSSGIPRLDAPTPHDLQGVWSLYGGGAAGPADLLVRGADGAVRATLYGVAPPGITQHTVFDTDGDGCCEVLVFRTDRAGNGVLMVFRFDRDCRLTATSGPFFGMAAPGMPHAFVVTDRGERLLVARYPQRWLVRQFDRFGELHPRGTSDLDVGRLEAAVAAAARAGQPAVGDLDGDGTREAVVRR